MKMLSRLNKIDIIHSSCPALTFDDFQTEPRDRDNMRFVSPLKNHMRIKNKPLLLFLQHSSSIAYTPRSLPHYSINMVAMSLAQATVGLLLFTMSVPRSSAAQQVSFSSYNLKQL
jgi:hypothetical protein